MLSAVGALMPNWCTGWSAQSGNTANPPPRRSSAGVSKEVPLWNCPTCGGEYEAAPKHRSARKTGCPQCSKKATAKPSYRSRPLLKDDRPDLAAEFVSEANTKSLDSLTSGSRYRAIWRCSLCKKEFQRTIYERTTLNAGCHSCASQNRKGNRGSIEIQWKLTKATACKHVLERLSAIRAKPTDSSMQDNPLEIIQQEDWGCCA